VKKEEKEAPKGKKEKPKKKSSGEKSNRKLILDPKAPLSNRYRGFFYYFL